MTQAQPFPPAAADIWRRLLPFVMDLDDARLATVVVQQLLGEPAFVAVLPADTAEAITRAMPWERVFNLVLDRIAYARLGRGGQSDA